MFVFKYGGHAIPEGASVDPSIEYLAGLIKSGVKMVVVHGGGPQINRELEIHGIKSEMIGGFRKTTPEVFEVVQRTLSGEVLRNLTNQFISQGINAVGISAGDGNLIRARNEKPELGLVGVVSAVNPDLLNNLLAQGITPVISPIAVDSQGLGLTEDTIGFLESSSFKVNSNDSFLASKPSLSKTEIAARADAQAIGLPPKVLP